MRVWIVTIGEPLIIDGSNVRLLRSGILANKLVENGHDVIFFNSTFNHVSKKQRYSQNKLINISDRLKLFLIKSTGYKHNVSLMRLVDHYIIARKFNKSAKKLVAPDLIFCSLPTIELAYFSVLLGKKFDIPIIIDVRDLWPDIFYRNSLNIFKKGILNFLFLPSKQKLKFIFSHCTSIVGITKSFVSWAENKTDKPIYLSNKNFPLSNQTPSFSITELEVADNFWDSLGVLKVDSNFNICLFASFGNVIDIITIIKSAKVLQKMNSNAKFIICGDGEKANDYKSLSEGLENVIFVGWVNSLHIYTLMLRSHVGILPYKNMFDFQMSIPNKVIEYLSASLPVLTCLKGEVKSLVETFNCGEFYDEGDHEDLANKVSFLRDNYLTNNYRSNSHHLYKTHFDSTKVYDGMINHIEETINNYKIERRKKLH